MIATPLGRRLLTCLLVAGIFGSACTSQSVQTNTGNQTLIVETSFVIDSLDPGRAYDPTPYTLDKAIYDTLVTMNPSDLSKPYPSLATSFTASPDGKTFTFQLRHGVKFASGNPLTSADVVWSLTRDRDIGAPSGASVVMMGLATTAPDPYTVVITAAVANPAVPVLITSPNAGILDSQLVEQHGGTNDTKDKAESYLNSASAGSGPYMIQSVDTTSQVVLKANPMYWGVKPAYGTVIFRNAPVATQRLDIQDGQAQMALDIPATDIPSLNSSKVNVINATSGDQSFLGMNASPAVSSLTANQDFRDAVRYGLDYKGLVALAGKGALQSTGFVPVGYLGALPASDAIQRNLPLAQADLAKVGVANPTVQLDYFTDVVFDGLPNVLFATKIQSDLKEVGITVNLVGSPIAVLVPKLTTGKSQMWLSVANPADYPDPSDFLGAAPGQYHSLFMNWKTGLDPSIDAQFGAASSAVAPADRESAYQALGRSINAKAIWVHIFLAAKALVVAKSVHAIMDPFFTVDLGQVT